MLRRKRSRIKAPTSRARWWISDSDNSFARFSMSASFRENGSQAADCLRHPFDGNTRIIQDKSMVTPELLLMVIFGQAIDFNSLFQSRLDHFIIIHGGLNLQKKMQAGVFLVNPAD